MKEIKEIIEIDGKQTDEAIYWLVEVTVGDTVEYHGNGIHRATVESISDKAVTLAWTQKTGQCAGATSRTTFTHKKQNLGTVNGQAAILASGHWWCQQYARPIQ